MPRLRTQSLVQVHQLFGQAAENWKESSESSSLRGYCFRHGVGHLTHLESSPSAHPTRLDTQEAPILSSLRVS